MPYVEYNINKYPLNYNSYYIIVGLLKRVTYVIIMINDKNIENIFGFIPFLYLNKNHYFLHYKQMICLQECNLNNKYIGLYYRNILGPHIIRKEMKFGVLFCL